MYEYLLRKFFYKFPLEIIKLICCYFDFFYVLDDIKKGNYIENGLWYKRIICTNVVDIRRDEISYFDWYRIFHSKDYNMLVKFENKKVKKLLETKSLEEINKIHMDNINTCDKRNFFNYKPNLSNK